MQITKELVFNYYKYFIGKKYNYNSNYRFILSKRDEGYILSFIKLLEADAGVSLGKEFLYRYFLFQFNYWDGVNMQNSFSDLIQLSFVIGKKAFQRYLDRNQEFDWTIEKYPIITKYGILRSDLIKDQVQVREARKLDTEAVFKLAAFNKAEGFVNCIDFTTLFDPKSSICAKCKFTDDCKKQLKKQYPKIYLDRRIK